VLTGVKENLDGYIHFPYSQITVIPEGDDVHEFMGWASISPKKMSVSPSFPGRWLKRIFTPDARTLGGRRAMIQSGEYESVLPMDIMAEYLIKAIKSQNIDDMERLGIYEIAPEDFALAEVIDSSKQPLQAIVRNGLDYLRKEIE
jgi:Na+-transporting NADH:ubiquinone oxidoreductase subunit A